MSPPGREERDVRGFQNARPGELIVTTSPQMLQDLFTRLKPVLAPAEEAGWDTSRVYLLLDELLSNVYRHGYLEKLGEPIGVRLRVQDRYCHLAVRDLAPVFDSALHAESRSAPHPESGQTGGMGLVIVQSMCESFTHQMPHEGGNALYLVMKLQRRHATAGTGAGSGSRTQEATLD
jgi:anti-sigma regulatory factor (Ser/Thr protein kinase)